MLAFSGGEALPVPPRTLMIGAQAHPGLCSWPDLTGWTPHKSHADVWDRAGLTRTDAIPDGTWPTVLVLPGKSRDETLAWFAMARQHLAPGGTLAAAMPNTAGASRFEKEFSQATGGVTSIQKHKCRAFFSTEDGTWNETLFAAWAELGKPTKLADAEFLTQAGIFSSDHIDPGSLLLAAQLPAHLHGTLADLGAGWGFLTDAVLRKCPGITRADLYEQDQRALDCARANLSAHTTETRLLWHDVTTGLLDTYDVIVMNPPFHTGQATDIGLGRTFLTRAAASLRRGGRLLLVANRQLPYESILDSLQLSWRKTAEDRVYKILIADKYRS